MPKQPDLPDLADLATADPDAPTQPKPTPETAKDAALADQDAGIAAAAERAGINANELARLEEAANTEGKEGIAARAKLDEIAADAAKHEPTPPHPGAVKAAAEAAEKSDSTQTPEPPLDERPLKPSEILEAQGYGTYAQQIQGAVMQAGSITVTAYDAVIDRCEEGIRRAKLANNPVADQLEFELKTFKAARHFRLELKKIQEAAEARAALLSK